MYKLLIVDDEPLVCIGVQSMIDWQAIDVEIIGTAKNGEEALTIINEQSPDIVITDIKMPVKDGLTLVKEARAKNDKLPVFIMLTNFDDFQYARKALQLQAIDYLIKLELDADKLSESTLNAIKIVDEYKKDMPIFQKMERSNLAYLREKFFVRLFNNLFENEEMYEIQKKDLEINIDYKYFLVANCIINKKNISTKNDDLFLFSNVIKTTEETLKRYFNCYVVPLDAKHFTIIFCLDDEENYRDKIKDALIKTNTTLFNYVNVELHIALGQLVDSLRKINISYRQSQLRIHGIRQIEPIVFFEENTKSTDEYITEVQEIRAGIRQAFEELDTSSLNDSLTIVANRFREYPDDLLQAMDATCNILYMAISLLPNGEKEIKKFFADYEENYLSLYNMHDTDQIAKWIEHLRDGLIKEIDSQKQNYSEHIIHGVKVYINNNLDKKLSLQTVSAVFNFNPNYLSQLFAKTSGEGFVEYITNARITTAKEIMKNENLKIYEIAEKVGFDSSFYFSKVFKKKEGISPREYYQKFIQK